MSQIASYYLGKLGHYDRMFATAAGVESAQGDATTSDVYGTADRWEAFDTNLDRYAGFVRNDACTSASGAAFERLAAQPSTQAACLAPQTSHRTLGGQPGAPDGVRGFSGQPMLCNAPVSRLAALDLGGGAIRSRADFVPAVPADWEPDLRAQPRIEGGNGAPTVTTPVAGPYTDKSDWHIPTLDEVFNLAQKYPDKKIILDTKTSGDTATSARLGQQIVAMLHEHPEMLDRIIITNPDRDCLQQIKNAFKNDPDPRFQGFKSFAYDDEHLNDFFASDDEKSPLTGAGDNSWVSVGEPKTKAFWNFSEVEEEVRKAHAAITDPDNPSYGKKLMAWVINDADDIRTLVKDGVDGLITDDPEGMNKTLDEMGYGPAGQDARRPMVIAHHGVNHSQAYPENTLPSIEHALRNADAVEVDVCSAKDGIVVFHDDDPNAGVTLARNLGLDGGNAWRPTLPDIGTAERGRRVSDMTIDEMRHAYGYERNATGSVLANGLLNGTMNVLRAPGALLSWLGNKTGIVPLSWLGQGLDWVVDKGIRPVATLVTKAVNGIVTTAWHGVTSVVGAVGSAVKSVGSAIGDAVKSVGHFFKKLFG